MEIGILFAFAANETNEEMRPAPLAVILLIGASACGQRGDLYLRDDPPPGIKPATEIYRPIPYPDQGREGEQQDRK